LREWDPRWNLRRRITDVAFPPPERKDTANNACEQQPAKGLADLVRPGLTCLFLQNRQWRKLFILHTGVGAGILFFIPASSRYPRTFRIKEPPVLFIGKNRSQRTSGSRRLKESKNRLFRVFEKKSVSKNGQFQVFETKNQFQRTTGFHERTGKDLAV
jgi:hypothetical protein